MNINDVLIRVLKKDEQTSEQILHRNEEEGKHPQEIIARDREYAEKLQDESEHPVEIQMREARDREIAEKMQKKWEEEQIAEKFWEEKHALEVRDREIAEEFQKEEDERWHSDELKEIEKATKDLEIAEKFWEEKHALEVRDREIAEKFQKEEDERWQDIEKETKGRKLELERLRVLVAARELKEEIRLLKAEEEMIEIAQLKRALAAEEDNRRVVTRMPSQAASASCSGDALGSRLKSILREYGHHQKGDHIQHKSSFLSLHVTS
jgi:hypothetical protein